MTSTADSNQVPFFVLRLDDHSICKARVLFSVPTEWQSQICAYPILCRGAAFPIATPPPEHQQPTSETSSSGCCFVSTTFESPQPEEAAAEIARRIASRIACIRAEHSSETSAEADDDNDPNKALDTSYASSISSHILGF